MPASPPDSNYTRFSAKDDDSDSDIEEARQAAVKASKRAKVPDLDGVRFCRVCSDFLPLGRFPRGKRRYTCKQHLWQRTGSKSRKRLLKKPRKQLLARLWALARRDSKVLGQSMSLKQADIDTLLDKLEDFSAEVAVMPIDLTMPVTKENTMLVSKHARRQIMDCLRRNPITDNLALTSSLLEEIRQR